MNYYSSFKAAWHISKIQELREAKLPTPIACQVDITNLCPHACRWCFYRGVETKIPLNDFNPTDTIPIGDLKRIVDQAEELGVKSWEITGGGEPTVHPHLDEFIDCLNAKGMEVALITNGDMLKIRTMDKLRGATWVRFSLDAATDKTWRMEHNPKTTTTFKDILDKIRHFKSIANQGCKVGVSFVVNPLNYHEMVDATRMVRDLGVDNIRFSVSYTSRREKLFEGIESKIARQIAEAKTYEDNNFKVFSFSERIFDLALKEKDYGFCGYQHFWLIIGANQKVWPCCALKYQEEYTLGDLRKESLKDIWFGERRRVWLRGFKCRRIPCWFDDKNRFIQSLVVKPGHVNFI